MECTLSINLFAQSQLNIYIYIYAYSVKLLLFIINIFCLNLFFNLANCAENFSVLKVLKLE